jgi:heptosyltransferase-2
VQQRFSLAATVPWFGLNPSAEYGPAKRWPRERFLAAAAEAQRRTNCRWLILGGPADAALAAELSNSLGRLFPSAPPLNFAGQTTLRELCALLKLCRLLLTNDTGPMHVAAAVGTPVVAIFGSTSPELTGPGLPGDSPHHLLKSDAACSPCFRRVCPIDFRCMTGISVERVVDAVGKACATGAPKPL